MKSVIEEKLRAGRNEVSRNWLARSTMPLDSGSNGFNCTIFVANAPQNADTPSASLLRRPMPASLSQTKRRGTASNWPESSDHMPASRSGVVRDGSITAVMNREKDATITSTGGDPTRPSPRGTSTGGNHKSHCA